MNAPNVADTMHTLGLQADSQQWRTCCKAQQFVALGLVTVG